MIVKYTGENLEPSYKIARKKSPREKGGDGYGVCWLLKQEEKERIKRWRGLLYGDKRGGCCGTMCTFEIS